MNIKELFVYNSKLYINDNTNKKEIMRVKKNTSPKLK